MDKEKTLSDINMGKTARLVLDFMAPIFDNEKARVIAEIKNMAREGTHTAEKLLARSTELCTLDNVKSKIERLIRQGASASTKLNEEEKDARRRETNYEY